MTNQIDCMINYSNSAVYEAIIRLDGRVKHHFINTVTKELTDHCCKAVKNGASKLRAAN
jgi:hypothetical protein